MILRSDVNYRPPSLLKITVKPRSAKLHAKATAMLIRIFYFFVGQIQTWKLIPTIGMRMPQELVPLLGRSQLVKVGEYVKIQLVEAYTWRNSD